MVLPVWIKLGTPSTHVEDESAMKGVVGLVKRRPRSRQQFPQTPFQVVILPGRL